MSCCVSRVDGASATGGASGAQDQAFSVVGVNTPAVNGTTDTAIAFFTGATTQVGATALPVTRVDNAANGSIFQLTQAGVYQVQAQLFLPVGGTAGVMIGWSLDTTAALLLATTNPDQWLPSIGASDLWQTWGAGSIAALNAVGTCTVTQAAVAGGLGLLRMHMTNLAGAAPTQFDMIPAFTNIRVRRIGDAQ